MARGLIGLVCVAGWIVVAGAIIVPVVGVVMAGFDARRMALEVVAVPPERVLLLRSLLLAGTATAVAVAFGLLPAALLGSVSRRWFPVLLGLTLAPLLIPPQVFIYAWELPSVPGWFQGGWGLHPREDAAIRAGLVSAGWLWPVVAILVAAGWRTSGRGAWTLAMLDATPTRAFFQAVLPVLRPYLVASAALVFGLSLLDYTIPHFALTHVYSTELMVLVMVGAPAGQIVAMSLRVLGIIAVLAAVCLASLWTTAKWGTMGGGGEEEWLAVRPRHTWWLAWVGTVCVWAITVAMPAWWMLDALRDPRAWTTAFTLFPTAWRYSVQVALAAAAVAVLVSIVTVLLPLASRRRWIRRLAGAIGGATVLTAALPPATLGIGFVVIYNGFDLVRPLYTRTFIVWVLALVSRFAAVAVLIVWMAAGARRVETVDQARTDGAGTPAILAHVLLPMMRRPIAAAALIIALLALFEVVVTQLVAPVETDSIAFMLLTHMHFGRQDVVIAMSLGIMVAGIVIAQICAWLLVRSER